MEPHELAIAALNQFVDSSSQRRLSTPSGSSAPGKRFQDKMMQQSAPETQKLSQESWGFDNMSSAVGYNQEQPNNSALGGLQSASNSQSTIDGRETPPTSTSDGLSSQNKDPERLPSQLSGLSQLVAAAEPLANTSARPSLSIAPTAGLKRLADGQVKPMVLSPRSPHSSKIRGHSRNTSAVSVASSASSKMGELSSELRTRLSYAMVKVNNGWQSNSIDEVESLASQAGSPTSSTSTLYGRRNLTTSPRTDIANLQSHANSFPPNSVMRVPVQDFDLYSRNDPPSRTYESFWKSHTTSNPVQRSSQTPTNKLSLQSPAEIRPTPSSRRSHTPKFSKPPTIPGQDSGSSHNTSTPRTPNGRSEYMDAKSTQTPTAKTIQEQDAMEALLFMSSPGNSGNMGHAFPQLGGSQISPQQSPLRAEFHVQPPLHRGAPGRRVDFEEVAASTSTGSSEAGVRVAKAKTIRRSKADAVDQLLDEMGDSSSDEEELVLNYSSPRRVTAGRV